MKEILILSGKGGTGKTSLAGCLAHLCDNAVFCDCDVDASNWHLLLAPELEKTEPFFAGWSPVCDVSKCTRCGLCQQLCRFEGVVLDAAGPRFQAGLCEGCGVCGERCPQQAIALHPRRCGELRLSRSGAGPLYHAELLPGEENSGKLISRLRQLARQGAEELGASWLICDGPPGIGCPVISSMSGVDLVLAVTEPTPSGLHDLKRLLELAHQFETPVCVVINKWDLNEEISHETELFCQSKGYPVIGRIPFDPLFTELLRQGKTVMSVPDCAPAKNIKEIWSRLAAQLRQ